MLKGGKFLGLVVVLVFGMSAWLKAAELYVPSPEYPTIQSAIDAASAGDIVMVAPGTYYENIVMKDGVSVLGSGADVTIIDGQEGGSVVTASELSSGTVLSGFTITNGSAVSGGGIYVEDGSLTIAHCTIEGNQAIYGGGIFNESSSPTITNCIVSGNVASLGAGISSWGESSPEIINCIISGNSAQTAGAIDNGWYSSAKIVNCIISGNTAEYSSGGILNEYSSPIITNCTISDNRTSIAGGGIYSQESSATITNCIVWGNLPNDLVGQGATYSDIGSGETGGEGNISMDPEFVNPTAGDYHLKPISPCIDAGNNDAPGIPETDFEGELRIVDGTGDGIAIVDMGADEFVGMLDTIPPTTSISVNPAAPDGENGWFKTQPQVTLIATDNQGGSGVDKTYYHWDGNADLEYTGPIYAPEGVHSLYYHSTDKAGNVEEEKSQEFKVDITPPEITINSPKAKDYLHSETITLDFGAADAVSGLASVEGTLDGILVASGHTVDLLSYNLGSHSLTVMAKDNAGNSTTKQITFNIVVTIDSLIDLVDKCFKLGWIDNTGVANSLKQKLISAKRKIEAGENRAAKNILRAFINEVAAQKGKHITQQAADILIADANYLISQL